MFECSVFLWLGLKRCVGNRCPGAKKVHKRSFVLNGVLIKLWVLFIVSFDWSVVVVMEENSKRKPLFVLAARHRSFSKCFYIYKICICL